MLGYAATHDEAASVLPHDDEWAELMQAAKRLGMTTAEWVRQSLRAARDAETDADVQRKLAAVRRAASLNFPTADVETLLNEIGDGYRQVGPSTR